MYSPHVHALLFFTKLDQVMKLVCTKIGDEQMPTTPRLKYLIKQYVLYYVYYNALMINYKVISILLILSQLKNFFSKAKSKLCTFLS